jgi:hypothetical protein
MILPGRRRGKYLRKVDILKDWFSIENFIIVAGISSTTTLKILKLIINIEELL